MLGQARTRSRRSSSHAARTEAVGRVHGRHDGDTGRERRKARPPRGGLLPGRTRARSRSHRPRDGRVRRGGLAVPGTEPGHARHRRRQCGRGQDPHPLGLAGGGFGREPARRRRNADRSRTGNDHDRHLARGPRRRRALHVCRGSRRRAQGSRRAVGAPRLRARVLAKDDPGQCPDHSGARAADRAAFVRARLVARGQAGARAGREGSTHGAQGLRRASDVRFPRRSQSLRSR